MKGYFEKNKALSKSIDFREIIELSETTEPFCIYENGNQIAIAEGVHIEISVNEDEIIIKTPTTRHEYNMNELCKDLFHALSEIEIVDWRMYGFAVFSLARYTYGLKNEREGKDLFHFFIPEKEYRICGKEILLRSLTPEGLADMERKLQSVIEDVNNSPEKKLLDSSAVINYDEEYYKSIVATGVDEIKSGKYQKVILSRKVPLRSRLNMKETYINGRKVNTPARSYWCKMGDMEVVGFSPETVAEVDRDGNVYTFPLAGTRALTNDPDLNKKLRDELLHDTKEIAEHAISVKLAEEELKQVCEEDSVVVTEFMSVMERGTVQHLGSRLKGKLKTGLNSWYALCKLFPAVTASGIPKKEAIEAIGRIEKDARGLYSGSVMTYDSDGTLDAALVLRSIFQTDNETWVRVGAGIVNMSNPEREFTETQEKVSSIAKQLIIEG